MEGVATHLFVRVGDEPAAERAVVSPDEGARAERPPRRLDGVGLGARPAGVAVRGVEARLDASVSDARSAAEQEAADELVHEMESALEAADEVSLAAGRPRA